MTDFERWRNATPTRRGEAWIRRGGQETAIYDPDTGQLHLVNASALAIWELCDGSTRGEEMVEALAEVTSLNRGRLESDVAEGLDALEALGLLVRRY